MVHPHAAGPDPAIAPAGNEIAGYLPHRGEQLYFVHHRSARPAAHVLLAGPFASERPHSYSAWVGWARFLAGAGFDAVRFDYRGVGESTGTFEAYSFRDWADDVATFSRWVDERQPVRLPLVIHGLGLGALLAAEAFSQGSGNALLIWSAPFSGRDVLREGLLRRMSLDFALQPRAKRKSTEDYVALLNSGETIEVEGYRWTRNLWYGAEGFDLAQLLGGTGELGTVAGRRWASIRLDRTKVPLVPGAGSWHALNPRAIVGRAPLSPDFSSFFGENVRRLRAMLESAERQVR